MLSLEGVEEDRVHSWVDSEGGELLEVVKDEWWAELAIVDERGCGAWDNEYVEVEVL